MAHPVGVPVTEGCRNKRLDGDAQPMTHTGSDDRLQPKPVNDDTILFIEDDHFTENSVCLLTGGGSGIGVATALALAANGLRVVATDEDTSSVAELDERARELDVAHRIDTIVADLGAEDELDNLVETAANQGELRYLANIAGMQHIDPIETFPMDTYDRMHEVMLRAPIYLARETIPHISACEDGSGAIGNLVSVHGHYVTSDKVGFNALKFGLRGLTQSIAAEGGSGLRSFSVSPGYVKVGRVADQIPTIAEQRGISVDEVIEEVLLGQSRVKELMDPIEVGNLFVFGFSRHANHLNGGDLLFDGGTTLTYE